MIRGSGKKICYPRVEGDHLNLMLVDSLDELFASRWQLREPVAYEPLLQAPDKIDLILVPGLAFSQSCQRLGRGGGYYDRLLASENLRARKIGVCFDLQTFPELPVESHDVCVDAVVTEMGIFPSAA